MNLFDRLSQCCAPWDATCDGRIGMKLEMPGMTSWTQRLLLPPRSVLACLALMFVSCGLFFFFWIYLLMNDVNRLYKTKLINVRVSMAILLSVLLFYFCVLFFGEMILPPPGIHSSVGAYFFTLLVTAILLYVIILVDIARIYSRILWAYDKQASVLKFVFILLLSLPWFASVPYMQVKFNRLT